MKRFSIQINSKEIYSTNSLFDAIEIYKKRLKLPEKGDKKITLLDYKEEIINIDIEKKGGNR